MSPSACHTFADSPFVGHLTLLICRFHLSAGVGCVWLFHLSYCEKEFDEVQDLFCLLLFCFFMVDGLAGLIFGHFDCG